MIIEIIIFYYVSINSIPIEYIESPNTSTVNTTQFSFFCITIAIMIIHVLHTKDVSFIHRILEIIDRVITITRSLVKSYKKHPILTIVIVALIVFVIISVNIVGNLIGLSISKESYSSLLFSVLCKLSYF